MEEERTMKTKAQSSRSILPRGAVRRRFGTEPEGLRLRRILVPLDFSGKSRQALEFAVPLAARYGGTIFLIHVIEPIDSYSILPGEMGVPAPDSRIAVEPCIKRLSALARELVPPELFGKVVVHIGRAYYLIVETAKDLEADLIVMTTHGYTGLKHVLLGSTAERVARHAACPVLTVRRR